jgi:very-short-patch-repair endonuclease
MRDLDRQAHLTAAGWRKIFRFRAGTVLHSPASIPATIRGYLAHDARRSAAQVISAA